MRPKRDKETLGEAQPHHQGHLHDRPKSFRFRFVIWVSLLLSSGVVLSGILLFVLSTSFTWNFPESLKFLHVPTESKVVTTAILLSLLAMIIIAIAIILGAHFTSSKIGHSLELLEGELEKIANGDLTKTVLIHKKDKMKNMAILLNEIVTNFHRNLSEIKGDIKEIKHLAETTEDLDSLQQQLDRLIHKLESYFKL